jgi:hypothetical protein
MVIVVKGGILYGKDRQQLIAWDILNGKDRQQLSLVVSICMPHPSP